MAGVRTANSQVDIMRFGLSISASTATKVGRISPVAARVGECPLTETDSGCSAGEAKLVFLPHTRRSLYTRDQLCWDRTCHFRYEEAKAAIGASPTTSWLTASGLGGW